MFGESLIIMCQNFLVIFLIWNYNKTIGAVEKVIVIAFFIAYAHVLFNSTILTREMLELVSGSTIALSKFQLSSHFVDIAARIP